MRKRIDTKQMLIADSRRLAWLEVALMANPDSNNLLDLIAQMDYSFRWCFRQSMFAEPLLVDKAAQAVL